MAWQEQVAASVCSSPRFEVILSRGQMRHIFSFSDSTAGKCFRLACFYCVMFWFSGSAASSWFTEHGLQNNSSEITSSKLLSWLHLYNLLCIILIPSADTLGYQFGLGKCQQVHNYLYFKNQIALFIDEGFRCSLFWWIFQSWICILVLYFLPFSPNCICTWDAYQEDISFHHQQCLPYQMTWDCRDWSRQMGRGRRDDWDRGWHKGLVNFSCISMLHLQKPAVLLNVGHLRGNIKIAKGL